MGRWDVARVSCASKKRKAGAGVSDSETIGACVSVRKKGCAVKGRGEMERGGREDWAGDWVMGEKY